jgi:PadR family transcriptional regulator, regulatory protein PadR
MLTIDIEIRYHGLPMARPAEILQGTLDLLILRTLELQPMHGVGIADRIEQVTGGVFVVGPGSLFPALHRLAERGWIEGRWGELESGRRAKSYTLTGAGRKRLLQEKRNWHRILTAVTQVLAEES